MDEAGGMGAVIVGWCERTGQTQADLARRAGLPPQRVSAIVTGTTKLPKPEVRRRLAAAMGMTHVDLLVAAGELTPDEATQANAPVTTETAAADVHAAVDRYTWDEWSARAVIGAITSFMGSWEARDGH